MTARSRAFLFLAALGTASALAAPAPKESPAGDWPQWRGPERTGISTETGLLKEWPKEGPKLLWKTEGLGGGYSTPSVVGGRIYVMGAKGQGSGKGKKGGGASESVFCLDAKDGKEVWTATFGRTAGGYPGPRSTPTVDNGLVYAISSDGTLACLNQGKGDVVWKKNLKDEFGGRSGGWAYAESPLIDGDRLVCTPGGDKATLVCLDKKTGKELLRGSAEGLVSTGSKGKGKGRGRSYSTAAYSSVVVANIAGKKTYVQFLSGGVVGFDATTGKALWHYDSPANGTANASTPIVYKDAVFAASGYGTGGGRADIVKSNEGLKAEEKYFVKTMQNHHGGMVLVGGHVFGTNNGSLVCVDFESGEVAKTVRGAGKGSVTFADGMIYHRGEDGTMCLIEADPKTLAEKGKFSQPNRSSNKAWAHPVVAGGRLYLRDWDTLLVYDVKK